MPQRKSYLSQAHIDALKQAERDLHDLLPEIDRAEACGIDCSDIRQGFEFLKQRITQYLSHYGSDESNIPGVSRPA
jgi:hypothetical protein